MKGNFNKVISNNRIESVFRVTTIPFLCRNSIFHIEVIVLKMSKVIQIQLSYKPWVQLLPLLSQLTPYELV